MTSNSAAENQHEQSIPGANTVLTDEAMLRELLGDPSEIVRAKVSDRLNELTRRFVDLSPFVLLGTSAPDGTCDEAPRGDPPGFVRVLDERTLLLPERPGNRLADSLRNILRNGHVGLLFVTPGVGDTLRVNGRATIVTDVELLAASAVEGKTPKLGLFIEIDEVFTHCSKAFLRSELMGSESLCRSRRAPHLRRDPPQARSVVRRRVVRRGSR
jgi:PPOX class probable FMN-dependent enzyme